MSDWKQNIQAVSQFCRQNQNLVFKLIGFEATVEAGSGLYLPGGLSSFK